MAHIHPVSAAALLVEPLAVSGETLGKATGFVVRRGAVAHLFALGAWPPLVALPVTRAVFAVGYPLGVSSSGLAVWVRGSIASEPDLEHDGLPMFLVDARTRRGQSGSPVVYSNGGGRIAFRNGSLIDNGSEHVELLGVYSGRVTDDSDLGRVFRVDAIAEIVHHGLRGSFT